MPKIRVFNGERAKAPEFLDFFYQRVFRPRELEKVYAKAAKSFRLRHSVEISGGSGVSILLYDFKWSGIESKGSQSLKIGYTLHVQRIYHLSSEEALDTVEKLIGRPLKELDYPQLNRPDGVFWNILVEPTSKKDYFFPWDEEKDPDTPRPIPSNLPARIQKAVKAMEKEFLKDPDFSVKYFGFWFFSQMLYYMTSPFQSVPWYVLWWYTHRPHNPTERNIDWDDLYRRISLDPRKTLEEEIADRGVDASLYSPAAPWVLYWYGPDDFVNSLLEHPNPTVLLSVPILSFDIS